MIMNQRMQGSRVQSTRISASTNSSSTNGLRKLLENTMMELHLVLPPHGNEDVNRDVRHPTAMRRWLYFISRNCNQY
jgi:hypothetical protein